MRPAPRTGGHGARARALAAAGLEPDSCCKRHGGGAKKLYGTAFNTGDYMVAVQWYERLYENGDGERREFVRGERMIDVINSTELRLTCFDMGPFPWRQGTMTTTRC